MAALSLPKAPRLTLRSLQIGLNRIIQYHEGGFDGLISKRNLASLIGPLIFLLLAIMPPLPLVDEAAALSKASDPRAPQIALGALLWIASWWVLEVVPLGLTGLLAAVLFSLLGYISWGDALRSFAEPIIWIFMGGFVIAKAFQVWGLDRRVALRLALIYKGSNPMLAAFFISCLPAFLLTATGSITASTSVVYPIALSYITLFSLSPRFSEAMMLSLGEAATAGAMLFLISTPPNLVAKQVLEQQIPNFKLTFFDWFILGTPQAVAGLLITWLIVFKVLNVEERIVLAKEIVERELNSIGRMSPGEKLVILIFLLTLSLWLVPGILVVVSSLNPSLVSVAELISRFLPEAAPAALAILLLGLLKVRGRPLLTFEEIASGIDWNVIFLFGGGIAMGKGLDWSGFSRWLALIITNAGFELNEFTLSAIGALMGFAITFPASNTASAMISIPVITSIARGAGLNPLAPVISTALACSISSALPSTTPPMAIVYGSGKV
ncbi:MAG: DASS family sodium-coupled anion symporter, partial [Candidatus Korarchaeum sp.]|nr:DASS family sodium-coupled anion symporter [Candidatus Korarchaeum sp.]MDW8034933.1 DASS family sodium-coupled anion symporter [Candidatus Korarchaeum sp.]